MPELLQSGSAARNFEIGADPAIEDPICFLVGAGGEGLKGCW